MGKKHKCKKCPECEAGEKWAVPTADFFSLLLALFIALFAIASVNKEKIAALKEEFVKIYDYAPVPEAVTPVVKEVSESKPTPEATANPAGAAPVADGGSLLVGSPPTPVNQAVSEAVKKIQQELKNASMGAGPLDESMDGVLLKLPTSIPFRGANATIDNEELHLFLRRVTDIINTLPPSVDISIRGYTDNLPLPAGTPYKDNIELSAKRAETVMRELIQNGVAPERLSTAGFGSAKPIAENTTEANRAKNRRVEFYMYVSNDTPLDQAKQTNILDALSKLQK
ncbi:MAG: OmpA family protein [Sulfuricurvum sp.]|uniref:flagellar motor protein MotB n=1 Tax=Sulfuricurvum sp. TaxID=2025608 RepID=UPI0025F05703|nr:flagellar motor protein MotB [Sulfuricurvum sp.]MBV5320624.1 OmpA family protein [Sulfuricurvum sp.]